MGVYIKGITIEMLRNAPLEAVENLLASGDMVEVQEPHGRLVDFEEIEVTTYIDADGEHIETNAPTIIESEECYANSN